MVESIGGLVSAERVVLVTTPGFRERGLVERVEGLMKGRLAHVVDTVTPNPDIRDIDRLRRMDGLDDVDSIIGLGGGSSIDTAKALSRILLSPREEPLSERFWNMAPADDCPTIPIIAVPTTAGTGAEVTPTATVWDHHNGVKLSLSGDDLYPELAIVDPALTFDLPDSITISSGLDAISHAFESVWNRNASPLSTVLAAQSLALSMVALPRLKANGHDFPARSSIMQASLMAGLAISQTRTAISHSISYPLTLEFGVPHGIASGFALPEILEYNALVDDSRLESLANGLGYRTVSGLGNALRRLLGLSLSLPGPLSELSGDALTPELIGQMFTKGRMDNNLRPVELGDVETILRKALNRYGVR